MYTSDIIAICSTAISIVIFFAGPWWNHVYASKLLAAKRPKRKKQISLVSRFFMYVLPVITMVFVAIAHKVIDKFFVFVVAVNISTICFNLLFEIVLLFRKKDFEYHEELYSANKRLHELSNERLKMLEDQKS